MVEKVFVAIAAALLILASMACDMAPGGNVAIVAPPRLTPSGGEFTDDVTVSLSCETEGAQISWRKNSSSGWLLYEEPLMITASVTLEARAVLDGLSVSETVRAEYVINRLEQVQAPTFLPEQKGFDESVTVSIICGTDGAAIEYMLDDSGVWLDYGSSLTITETTSIKARATAEGMAGSEESAPVTYWRNGSEPTEFITIGTYNVENFDLGSDDNSTYPDQYDHIADFARNEELDVLVLNEMQTDDGDIAAFTAALDDADYSMPYWGSTSMSDSYNAIGVWSRYPLSRENEILDHIGPRSIYRFMITVAGREVWFYGCHLKSGATESSFNRRVNQASALEQYILANHDPLNDIIVVLGDMNTMGYNEDDGINEDFAPGGTMEYLQLKSDGDGANDFVAVNYTHIPSSYTSPGWESLLDHILLSPGAYENHYSSGSISVPEPPGDGWYGASDHYPVVLEMGF